MSRRRRCTIAPSIWSVLFLPQLACTLPSKSPAPEMGETLPLDDSSVPPSDDSSVDDSSAHVDDSCTTDDSSVTSDDIEWTLIDSMAGPITHEWAGCDYTKCDYADHSDRPELCGGVTVGIVGSQDELEKLYAESLRGLDYVPKIDFSSHMVGFSYLCCCTPVTEWIVVDDMTRVGTTLAFSMHIESSELGPATFGRPWVVVQIPIGHYNNVSHNLYE